MPALQCPSCGKIVRFEGTAGVCPHCAAIVRVPAPPAARSSSKSTSSSRSASESKSESSSKPASSSKGPGDTQLADLGEVTAGAEFFNPTEADIHSGHTNLLATLDPRLLYGFGAAVSLLVLFGLYAILMPKKANIGALPTPPAAPVVMAPPPPTQVAVDTQAPILKPLEPDATPRPASRPAWMALNPVKPVLPAPAITDELVEHSIKRAVAFLKTQLVNGQLINFEKSDMYAGQDALVVYSLLHAGEAIDDSTLSISDNFMQGLLNHVKQFEMKGDYATYERSLRASALAMFDREQDKTQLQTDKTYLQSSEYGGAYDYKMAPKGSDPASVRWDNSNSQYGVLGIWAASLAGEDIPSKYWNDVEKHWLSCQCPEGGWEYQGAEAGGSTITMTCAGVTTLCVTAEQLELIASKGKKDSHPQLSAAVNKALDWMGKEDHLTAFGGQEGYSLYGVERAALATGYRWFGNHDWYRELGARQIKKQELDGSWGGSPGGAGQAGEAAFRVLFLSRGRQPLLMDKLRFDGDWNDRPRDVAKLTQFASAQLEKPFAWGVADLSRNWWDWLESPMLFMSTDTAPTFTDDDCKKLRSYTDAGGLLFVHNEYASKDVDDFVKSLAGRLYPEYQLKDLPPDNVFYSTVFPMKTKPPLMGIGNGTRTFLVYSPKDITEAWVKFRPQDRHAKDTPNLQLGLNLFVAAAGQSDFRNRLNSPYEEVCDFNPIGTVPVVKVKYPGKWNAEPKAFERFGRWFQKQTSIALDVQPTEVIDIARDQGPVALLSGNEAVDFRKTDFKALHDYVANGGILLIDSTGGNKAFADSIKQSLMPQAFPGVSTSPMPANHPVLAGTGACMDALPRPLLKPFAKMSLTKLFPDDLQKDREARAGVQYAIVEKGAIIISDLDITTGLLNSGTFGIYGFTPAYDQSLAKNVILWALSRYHRSA